MLIGFLLGVGLLYLWTTIVIWIILVTWLCDDKAARLSFFVFASLWPVKAIIYLISQIKIESDDL